MPALVLFVFGLALRLLFQFATPDGGVGWHVGFQGDAPVWQDLAQKLAAVVRPGQTLPDDLLVPMRPPAMQWLVSALWNGDPAHVWLVRLVFMVLGAAIAPLLWLLLRRHTAPRVAFTAAALCAVSSNLLLLGSGVQVEPLYLVLVLVTLLVQPQLAGGKTWLWSPVWGALQGASCLVRAEHVLTTFVLAVLARRAGATWRTLVIGAFAVVALIAPWQWHANRMVDDYNTGAPPLPPTAVPWDAEAVTELRKLAAFQQIPLQQFVSDTVKVRGGTRVRVADLGIVHEAYGVDAEPLPHGFLAVYGALNFFLANTKEADAGFSADALARAPPLAGGDHRYPPGLRRVLPRKGQLAFSYPPHSDALAHGFERGVAELTAQPLAAAGRIAKKLWHAVAGATGGVGGYALPIGLSGVRRSVDLVTATGVWPNLWRAVVLLVAIAGLWSLRSVRGLWPLLAFALTKLVVVAAYFGYARHGALCTPVIALGLAAVAHRVVPARRWLAPALLGLLLAIDGLRCVIGVTTSIDGGAANAQPPSDFATRTLEFR